eukprot:8810546-Lingulodinium_polyedra.AAC.1
MMCRNICVWSWLANGAALRHSAGPPGPSFLAPMACSTAEIADGRCAAPSKLSVVIARLAIVPACCSSSSSAS